MPNRREFVKRSATALGAVGAVAIPLTDVLAEEQPGVPGTALPHTPYDGSYSGPRLNRVGFPLGGFGTGMICLEGTGALSEVSIRNHADVFNEPGMFAAVGIVGPKPLARVLEGPVPGWKVFGARNAAQGLGGSLGLPRYTHASCTVRFPFSTISLSDPAMPLAVQLTGWSPFTPGDADSSSYPVAGLEYRFTNTSRHAVKAVFSFNTRNFLPLDGNDKRGVRAAPELVGPRETGRAVAQRSAVDHGRRPRRAGESRLVPRRLVRSAHDGVEGGRSRDGVLAAADH